MSLRGDNTKAMPSVHNQIFAQISSETSDQFEAHEIQMSERYPKEFTAGKCVVGVVLGRLSMIDHLYGYVIRRE
ncbi:MAG TPA: hypothetical protein VLF63_00085, partial [Patescibacteria group bacterium]|nr:hypothetical protein [Patescibacteria group bacterium]